MITLSSAYKIAYPHIHEGLEIHECFEYEDYFVFPECYRNGEPFASFNNVLGVQKSSGTLCHIGFNTSKLCYCSWDFETLKLISDDIGEPTRKYSEEKLKAIVSSNQ